MTPAQARAVADGAAPPTDVGLNSIDACIVIDEHVPSERLDTGYFSGKGGSLTWGVAWTDAGRPRRPLIAGGLSLHEAHAVMAALRDGPLATARRRLDEIIAARPPEDEEAAS